MPTTAKRMSAQCKPGQITKTFEKLKIVLDVREAVKEQQESVIGFCLANLDTAKVGVDRIIVELKEVVKSCPELTLYLLGPNLLKRIDEII